jgi:hypothetical protein
VHCSVRFIIIHCRSKSRGSQLPGTGRGDKCSRRYTSITDHRESTSFEDVKECRVPGSPPWPFNCHSKDMFNTNFKKNLFYYGCGLISGAVGGKIWREYRFNSKKAEVRFIHQDLTHSHSGKWRDSCKAHDVHVHFSAGYSKNSRSMKKFIDLLDEAKIGKAVWMPIPTNIHQPFPYKTSFDFSDDENMRSISCGNFGRGMHYYLPQDFRTGQKSLVEDVCAIERLGEFEQYYDLSVDDISAAQWKKLSATERERVKVMIVGFHLTDANSIRYILKKMRRHPGVFKGVGEISVQKEVVSAQLATKYKPTVQNPVLGQLFDLFGYIGFPVVLHCDVDDFPQKGGKPMHFEGLKEFFIAHPKTTIIWAHAGGLGRYVKPSENHPELVQEILEHERCSHVHIDLSWDVVAERITKDKETCAKWAALIERFPDRFLYGSDSLEAKDIHTVSNTYAIYEKHLFPLLTEKTVDQVMRKNFDRIFAAAEPRIEEFEKTVLPSLRLSSTSNDWIELGKTSMKENEETD